MYKKYVVFTIGILLLGTLVTGGTYAYLSRAVTITNGTANVSTQCFLVDYNIKNSDTAGTNLITSIGTLHNITSLGNGSYQVDYTQSTSDTYMRLNLSSVPVAGKTYTLTFDVSGLNGNEHPSFSIYYNGAQHSRTSLANGSNSIIFTYAGTSQNSYVTFDDYQAVSTATFTLSNFVLYESNADIGGILFPSASPSGGLTGRVGLKTSSLCSLNGTGTIKLHLTSGTVGSAVAGHCENSNTLETLKEYTTSGTCSGHGTWVTNGTPLKYAVYDNSTGTGNPLTKGYITSSNIGGDITLYNNFEITSTQAYYYIFIWLDGYLSGTEGNEYTDVSFTGYVSAEATQTE